MSLETTIANILKVVTADPDDDMVLECAIISGTTNIITGRPMEKIIRYLVVIILMAGVLYAIKTRFAKDFNSSTAARDELQGMKDLIRKLERSFVLGEHKAYGVKVGFTTEQVYEIFPQESVKMIDLLIEGRPTPAMEISIGSKDFVENLRKSNIDKDFQPLIAELVNDKVYRIRVSDSCFKTHEGIRVGSTLEQLEQTYNEVIFGSAEGSIFVRVRSIHMAFELDCADQAPLEWYRSHERDLLDDKSKIIKIIVF